MFDRRARELCRPVLDGAGGRLARLGVRANALTAVGWLVGVGACVAVSQRQWMMALVAWMANRVIDGLDGALARRRGVTELGGYLDLLADFSVSAGFVVALALAEPTTRAAAVVLLFSYYLSGTALLAGSALLDRRGVARGDDRSINFLGGLAEGLETMVAYVVILIVPSRVTWVEWTFAAMVFVTALQRIDGVRRALRDAPRFVRDTPSQPARAA
jgi:phosphatidylglycerophosphate synthase